MEPREPKSYLFHFNPIHKFRQLTVSTAPTMEVQRGIEICPLFCLLKCSLLPSCLQVRPVSGTQHKHSMSIVYLLQSSQMSLNRSCSCCFGHTFVATTSKTVYTPHNFHDTILFLKSFDSASSQRLISILPVSGDF